MFKSEAFLPISIAETYIGVALCGENISYKSLNLSQNELYIS